MLKAAARRLRCVPRAPTAGAASPGAAARAAVGVISSSRPGVRVAFEPRQHGVALRPSVGPLFLSPRPCGAGVPVTPRDGVPRFGAVPLGFPCAAAVRAGVASQGYVFGVNPARDVSPPGAGRRRGRAAALMGCLQEPGVTKGTRAVGHRRLPLLSPHGRAFTSWWRSCWCCRGSLLV